MSSLRSVVHSSGVCEENFNVLSQVIQGYINTNRHDLALAQLELCATEREREMNHYKFVKRPNKNKINAQHQYVIDRVRGLMEKISIGLRIGVTTSEWSTAKLYYHGNYFVLKYKPDHLDKYHEIKRTTTNRIRPPTPPREPTPPRIPTPPSSSSNSSSSKSPSPKKQMTKSMKRRLKKKSKKTLKTLKNN